MLVFWVFIGILILAVIGYFLGRSRSLACVGGDVRKLHSVPGYHGFNVLLFTAVPALVLMVVWLLVQPLIVQNAVSSMIPADAVSEGSSLGILMSDVQRVAHGLDAAVEAGTMTEEQAASVRTEFTGLRERLAEVGVALASNVRPVVLRAAQHYRTLNAWGNTGLAIAAGLLSIGGFLLALRQIAPRFRARNTVEGFIKFLLIAAASIAILTTIGIILSLVFNTVEFFQLYPATDFFFGTVWSPSFGGGSELGILPLLWGTFYISLIALAVAVPVGLLAAVYLSEYAGPIVRNVAKPLIEVLAGIPTIVYGLFALLTVGPLLVSAFGESTVGWMQSGTAVMTAGLVMGIMLIPFVSSLSDDILNAVPQAMRDGSLGLGATRSETIKQVVMPAALPGIVGAILLAASRAIGETMIVVLGAGAAARLSLNPFDAMTTVTAKIVSQLTGDADFASPEALVAFALGMTLFVVTLALNILALYIVRKYREQYE